MIFEYKRTLFNTISGKLGGYIYYVWKKKTYCIRRTYVDTEEHPKQRIVREAFVKADDAFKGLGPEQRHAWRLAATRRKKYTNYAYFMHINIKLALAGKVLQLEVPAYGKD